MTIPDPIHVVLAANRSYFNGLLVTVLSLVRAGRDTDFVIHVIDGGLTGRQKEFIERRVGFGKAQNSVRFHPFAPESFSGFRLDYGSSYMTYARILMGSLISVDRVLYLDTDLLIGLDVRPVWETPLGNSIIAAVPDPSILDLKEDFPFDEDCGEHRYFNSGVMVVDLKRWRFEGVEERLLEMITASPGRFTWWDQTAMNALFRGRVSFLDPRWNSVEREMDRLKDGDCRIFHYVGPRKPWNCYRQSTSFNVWRAFFARYVKPSVTLCADSGFAVSRLQWFRHRLLRTLPPLRWLARLSLSGYAKLNRVVGTQALRKFDGLHANGSELVTVDKKAVRSYVSSCWS